MRRIGWDEVLLPACASLALVSAAYPWIILLGSGRPLSLGLCYLMTAVSLAAGGLSEFIPKQQWRRYLLVLSGIVFAVVVVWMIRQPTEGSWWSSYWLGWIGRGDSGRSSPQTETIILVVLYWFALGMSDKGWGEMEARRLLGQGLISFMSFLAVARLFGVGSKLGSGQMALPSMTLFLGSILMTLTMARARTVNQRGRQKGAEQATMSYSWVPLAVLMLLFALLISTPLLPRLVGWLLAALWSVVSIIIMVIAVPIGYLADWLITAVRSMVAGRKLELQPQPFNLGDNLEELQQMVQKQSQPIPLWLSVAFVTLVVLVVVIIVARRLALTNRTDDFGVDEERESLQPKLNLLGALRKLRRRRTTSVNRNAWPEGSIEALYHWVLQLGEQRGRARLISETPLEYQLAVAERVPDKEQFIANVTDAFERAKYGEELIPLEELTKLAAARDGNGSDGSSGT